MKIIATIQESLVDNLVPVMNLCGKPVLQWVIERAKRLDVKVSIDSESALQTAEQIMQANNDSIPGWKQLESILMRNPEIMEKCTRGSS